MEDMMVNKVPCLVPTVGMKSLSLVGRKQIHPTTKSCEKKFVFPDAYNPELPKSK